MNIRPIKKQEIPELLRILESNYPGETSSADQIVSEVEEMFSTLPLKPIYLVAEDEGKIKGYLGYAPSRINYRAYEFFSVAVDPALQGQGVGTNLVAHAIEQIKSLKRKKEDDYTILLTSTKPKFWEKFGFKTLTKIKINGSCLMALSI